MQNIQKITELSDDQLAAVTGGCGNQGQGNDNWNQGYENNTWGGNWNPCKHHHHHHRHHCYEQNDFNCNNSQQGFGTSGIWGY